ncbi:MAG: sodium-translocating pyrophosphatase, partial [bacterium]|nr:sodium-translocating pyrophosphatase [bacterium]
MQWILLTVAVCGVLAIAYVVWRSYAIGRMDAGNEEMIRIAGFIRDGAMAFLGREYRVLAGFVVVVAALLAVVYGRTGSSAWIGVSVLAGALCSAGAGYFGMRVATRANVRTAAAARSSLNAALKVAFSGGAVMGFCVVGLGVLGISLLFLLYSQIFLTAEGVDLAQVVDVLVGFSFGASSIALFARVGGGIYTKAADVGADLVGKVEKDMPEDDPRNPAVIADLVGDNVGDVAGMGADLFESYVGAIISSLVLGAVATQVGGGAGTALVFLPLALAGFGIIVSLLGTLLVRTREGGNPSHALHAGTLTAAILMLIGTFFLTRL